MRYPAFLGKNGTIGYVAPSFGCADESRKICFDHAREVLRERGYGEKLGPNCYLANGIGISNTPYECSKELTNGYCDPESDVLISCGGGELMCETMSEVDFERLEKAKPKWYMGYSDNTNMTFLLTTMLDTASIYGPAAKAFGMVPIHESIEDALAVLTGEKLEVRGYENWQLDRNPAEETDPLAPYLCKEKKRLKVWVPEGTGREAEKSREPAPMTKQSDGKNKIDTDTGNGDLAWNGSLEMRGRLLGGCMDCLVNLLGTRFDHVKSFLEKYEGDGIIWFLEACDLNVFSIRRAMWQMEEAGWFRTAKGFLIGRPLCFGQEMMGLDQYEAVLPIARKHQVPIVMDVDLGHLPPAMPIICGAMGNVNVRGDEIKIRHEMI